MVERQLPKQTYKNAAFPSAHEVNSRRTVLSYLIGIGCGYAYIYVLVKLFGQVLNPNPINQWRLEYLAKAGHEVGYFVPIYAHDLLLYIIVAIPFALLLSRLPPKNEAT